MASFEVEIELVDENSEFQTFLGKGLKPQKALEQAKILAFEAMNGTNWKEIRITISQKNRGILLG